ncbi:MAG: hypothetical protein COA78_06505 [Blastopirellula sp.]|nr:MAG: hypothetical protein COA78_06505 [Blastopirellula sp.]
MMENTKHNKFGWRYSLRALLMVITPLILWLGWYVNLVHYQRSTAEALQADGFSVYYDYHIADPAGDPPWLASWIGIDFCSSVVMVQGYQHRDLSLKHLGRLQHIDSLKRLQISINHSDEATFVAIGKLHQLEDLLLSTPPFPPEQLKHLISLKHLESIDITQPIGDEGIAALCNLKQLKKIRISSEQLTQSGIQQLAKLENLESLKLRGNLDISGETQQILQNRFGQIAIDDGSWKRTMRQPLKIQPLPNN